MKQTKLASRYAKALFDLAIEQKVLNLVIEDMKSVILVCRQNKDFSLMLQSPIIFTNKKEAIIKAIFEESMQKISLYFLLIITKKKREAILETIALQFIELYKDYKHITTATLGTAVPLDSSLRNKIISILKNQTKGEIELLEDVEKDLIGGFVLKYDDKQYDSSVKKQIKELRRNFKDNLYIKEF